MFDWRVENSVDVDQIELRKKNLLSNCSVCSGDLSTGRHNVHLNCQLHKAARVPEPIKQHLRNRVDVHYFVTFR